TKERELTAMSGYCFYAPEALELAEQAGIKEQIDNFAEENKKQTYILCRPLSKDDAVYDYDQAIAIFSSGMRPCLVDTGGNEDAFDEYVEDFIEDISFLSEKFKYREKIGRKKHWLELFKRFENDDLNLNELTLES